MDVKNIETDLTVLISEYLINLLEPQLPSFEIEKGENGTSFILDAFLTQPTELANTFFKLAVTYFDGESIIYMSVGESCTLEIPIEGGRYTQQTNENELLLILKSLILLGFEETVTSKNNLISKSVVNISLINGETALKIYTSALGLDEIFKNLYDYCFGKKVIVHKKYLPSFHLKI